MKPAITFIAAAVLPITLSACSNIQTSDLQYHHWNLISINNQMISAEIKSDLEFGEGFRINGKAGCNRFFGEAQLKSKTLTAPHLASTLMACHGEAQDIESAVINTLSQGAKATLRDDTLELKGAEYTLIYKLADWM